MSKIKIDNTEISVILDANTGNDFISLTDMLKAQDGDFFLTDWLRNRNTLDYIAVWERLNNPDFNYGEFAIITAGAGRNTFKISVKDLTEKCNVKCTSSKTGRYGGTYGHKDIAFHFGMWLSAEFQLILIKEFQRLKEEETKRINSEWDFRLFLSKANYTVHTDAIQKYIVPNITDEDKKKWIYAEEGDLLNVALFGFTAKQWRDANPDLFLKGYNVRDIADAHQLLVLSNLEGYNAILNQQGTDKSQKLLLLKKAAEQQLAALRTSIYTEEKIKSPFLPEKKRVNIPHVSQFDKNLKSLPTIPNKPKNNFDE